MSGNINCPVGETPMTMVFRNHARCKDCKVKRRTVFSGVNTTALDNCGSKQLVYIEKNSIILKPDVVLPYLYCIREGWCRVMLSDPEMKTTTLWYAGPGDMLGLSSVCSGESNSFTAIAMDDVTLCRIPADDFRKFLPALNGLSLNVAEKLSEEVGRVEKRTDALRRRIIQKEQQGPYYAFLKNQIRKKQESFHCGILWNRQMPVVMRSKIALHHLFSESLSATRTERSALWIRTV